MKLTKNYWFKAKHYGWGWYPATWQGWLITGVYVIVVINRAFFVSSLFDTASSFVFRYVFEVIFLTLPLLLICYLTGEKPGWRWGKTKKK